MIVLFAIAVLIFVLLLVFWSLQKNPNNNIVSSFWSKVETMFIESEDDNMWSANRFAYVITMLISNLIIWGAILYFVIHQGSFPDIPDGVIFIYGISNGVASITKVWQKREERISEQLENIKDKKDVE